MHRLLPQHPAIDAPAVAATVLLRWLSACILVCLVGTGIFYVLVQLGDDVSVHRRGMNAAAYRAQLYVDQREALLNYLVDSVVNVHTSSQKARAWRHGDDRNVRRLRLGTAGDGQELTLLLSARAEQTLADFGVRLVHIDGTSVAVRSAAHEEPSASFISRQHTVGNPLAPDGERPSDSRVRWVAPTQTGSPIYLYRAIGGAEPDASHWLGLAIDSDAMIKTLNGNGIGDFALLDKHGEAVLTQGERSPSASWMRRHAQDEFGWIWDGARPEGLALVKGIGEDGWRLVYHAPLSLLLVDIAPHLGISLLMSLAGVVALRALTRRIDRQLIQPALLQHRQLLESFDFGSTVIEMAPVGVCVLRGHDGTPMVENQLARDWLGNDAAAGDWLGNLRTGNADPLGERRSADYTTSDGRQLQVLAARTRYHGEDVLLCVFNDVSRHRQIQAALSAAKQAADAASQAKTAFLATMSHEIRTPLYGLLGTLELLAHTSLDARQSQYLATIEQSSSALLQLISEILDVTKIESGQLTLVVAPFSPLDLAESTLRAYAAAAERKGIRIMVCTDPALPDQVLGDAGRIRQILGNLLSNAIKFTDSGNICLRVRLVAREADMVSVSWQVTDTGVGIAQAEHARLFEPFRQIGTHNRLEGAGLGLSISDRLVRLMNGDIRLVSEPGLGSSFTMVLPLKADPRATPEDSAPKLLAQPLIYVRCSVSELADSGSEWLQRWGATVRRYEPGMPLAPDENAILLDSDPRGSPPVSWRGPRVTALPDAGDTPVVDPENPRHLTVTMFSIRAIANALARLQQSDAPVPMAAVSRPDALDLRVLVAEDNPINRIIMKEQLETLGCSVLTATDGQNALELCRSQPFDVVLTDINMPRMSGHALTRSLRQHDILVPVIGATASATPEERERCFASGMAGYLAKPVDIGTLRRALTQLSHGAPA